MKLILYFCIALFLLSTCKSDVSVTSLYLSQNNATLTVGVKLNLDVFIFPEDATNTTVSWESNNPEVAQVNSSGQVTAISTGTAVIIVTSNEDSNITAECKITVLLALDSDPVVVAYVIAGVNNLPDPTLITHINYAFGEVNSTFNGIKINNESRLMAVSGLKQQKPSLRVLLAIGGWGKGGFSEMAGNTTNRRTFAADCKRVVDQFNLDGIDMDWEYPTSSMAGIVSSPADKNNFTLLMSEIREAIGYDKLLTFASSSTAGYVDFKAVEPYVDFVNIMTYDIARPPFHQAGLYRSQYTSGRSCEESVFAHYNQGIPMNKLTLGIPFYGHGCCGIAADISYRDIINLNYSIYTKNWDDIAKAPYLTNSAGDFVLTYDDPQSIALKCEYILEKGMRGAMYWQYNQDDNNGSLRKAVYNGVMNLK